MKITVNCLSCPDVSIDIDTGTTTYYSGPLIRCGRCKNVLIEGQTFTVPTYIPEPTCTVGGNVPWTVTYAGTAVVPVDMGHQFTLPIGGGETYHVSTCQCTTCKCNVHEG